MINKSEWIPTDGFILEDKASEAVKADGNLLVIAGPGTGKTEMLAQKANYLFETGGCLDPYNILAISFKTDSASNLAERVKQRCPDLASHRFNSLTYDALAKRILDQFRNGLVQSNRPNADYLVQDEEKLRKIVCHVFGESLHDYQANTYWRHFSLLNQVNNDAQKQFRQIILHGNKKFQANLSFQMIMQLAIIIIDTNPLIKKAFRAAYPYVFLDEFQDTTDLQYQFIKTLFESSTAAITAVGDDKQRIMDFAGARKTIFSDFKDEFNSDELHLILNHRSAPRLIKLQMKMYQSLQAGEYETKWPKNWENDDGEISLIQSQDEYEEAASVAQDIMKKLKQGIKPDEIALLVKQNDSQYGTPIITALSELGIKSRVESKYQSLLKEPLVQIVLQSVIFAVAANPTEDWGNFFDLYLKSREITDVEDENTLYTAELNLNKFLHEISALITDIELSASKLVQHIIDFWTKEFFKSNFPQYFNESSLERTIDTFIELLNMERQAGGPWIESINSFRGIDTIPIMTIHKSKGLEFKAVYLIALDDTAFWSFQSEPDATRRALFVAVSRAKLYLTFTFAQSRSNLSKHSGSQSCQTISEFYDLINPFIN
ncbi:UvrD-helicase domain-containing protein [Liquorilactobacillus nagelii]|jgi:superfamily I DNA/RNA helicase|uniref:UvrD-helicase domain-containing protein n=2 Tax=Liquorilactobacillus nagelii TaxID=82688 RepID=UPI00242CD013|nr:ATP-dependent helicase [Liquorilactobacillus nagelii]MCI1699184.1 ATP-dependent helicase [Liquorilactobacillus nagelii]